MRTITPYIRDNGEACDITDCSLYTNYNDFHIGGIDTEDGKYCSNPTIYKDGKWAQLVKTVIEKPEPKEYEIGRYLIGKYHWSPDVPIKILSKSGTSSYTILRIDDHGTEQLSYNEVWYRYATTEEVEKALIAEAKKRGLIEGVSYNPKLPDKIVRRIDSADANYNFGTCAEFDYLCADDSVIWDSKDGWATPVTEAPKYKSLKFGTADVKCYKGYCEVEGKRIERCTIVEIYKHAIRYKGVTVAGWEIEFPTIKIGCQSDTIEKVKELLHAM
jgi:hypothetical protein